MSGTQGGVRAGTVAPGEAADRAAPWRLLIDPPQAPAWNMAVDEALLDGWRAGDPPIVRLYGWSPAALSLGRFQAADELVCPPGAVVVRRLSGGAAIHHRPDEVTYALVAPYALFDPPRPRTAYLAVHAALTGALRELGVPAPDGAGEGSRVPRALPRGLCFASATAEDLVVGGRKLIGSAQRRRGAVFLQHGSLPLSRDPRGAGTSLEELLGRTPARETVVRAICAALRHTLATNLNPSVLTPAETARARALEASRYGSSAWNRER